MCTTEVVSRDYMLTEVATLGTRGTYKATRDEYKANRREKLGDYHVNRSMYT